MQTITNPIFIVLATSEADMFDINVHGVFDNHAAAIACANHHDLATATILSLHHYEVQSTFTPEEEDDAEVEAQD